MKKNIIVQNAIETYIINNTELSPNYRRDAALLKCDLSYNVWENVLADSNSYFLSIMSDALERLNSDYRNDNYSDILREVETAIFKPSR